MNLLPKRRYIDGKLIENQWLWLNSWIIFHTETDGEWLFKTFRFIWGWDTKDGWYLVFIKRGPFVWTIWPLTEWKNMG